MTPNDLRRLADEATPGPWLAEPPLPGGNNWDVDGPLWLDSEGGIAEVDARLIALAPDLARLCAELGEALLIIRHAPHIGRPDPELDRANITSLADRALAKLTELEAP